MDHADPQAGGGKGIVDLDRAPVDSDGAVVGHHQPYQDLHERGLARSVFSENTMDQTSLENEVDIVTGLDGPEFLGDASELDRRGGC